MKTTYTWKKIKAGLIGIIALYFLLIFLGNIVDYGSNYTFVQHVLSMDTIFPNSTLTSRAITSPILWSISYRFIIIIEGITALLCGYAAVRLFLTRKQSTEYTKAKQRAYWGLFIGFTLFALGFITIGGEWFAMRQSEIRNGLNSATRNMTMIGIVLLAVASKDED